MSTRRSFEGEKGMLILDEGLEVRDYFYKAYNLTRLGLRRGDIEGYGAGGFDDEYFTPMQMFESNIVSLYLRYKDLPDDKLGKKAMRIRDFFHQHVLMFFPFGEEDE